MTTFCRITGCARNLPKPCYFPLLPPITPAEAKKLCRITGKASEIHSYSPIIAFGKPVRFDGTEGCKITKHESLVYVRPVFEKTKENEKSYSYLENLLKKMKGKLKKRPEGELEFVYHLSEQKTNLIVPCEMEEAIRTGELEAVSMSKDSKFVNVKIKQGRIIKMNLRVIQFSEINERNDLFYGRGQNKDVLEEQQEILNERNKRKANTMARKQRFEALDAKAEADELRDTVRPPYNKPRVKFNAKQRAEKLARMEAMMREQATNRAILLPKLDTKKMQDEQLQYERMLADIMKAQVSSINVTVLASGLDWHAANEAENAGFDWDSFPHEEWIDPVEIVETQVAKEEVLMREDVTNLEIVVSVETVKPALPMPEDVAKRMCNLKEDVLKKTEHVTETLKSVREAEIIPTFSDISKIAAGIETAEVGYLVTKEDKAEFVTKVDYNENEKQAVSGALVEVDEKKKFVAGQIIKLADQEAFVAGQTVETLQGKKFVPGQTIINKNGDISFLPGQCIKSPDENVNFVAGQIFNSPNGPKFVAGQVMDRGDGNSVFITGQTINTEEGPKFSPGEVTVDAYGEELFVPGMKMPTVDGEKFVTGQAFQTEEGLTFKPGQIMDTIEGPTFVPGKTFDTPEGKKFIKGDLVQDEEGKLKFEHRPFEVPKISEWLVIPNKELQPLAVADRNVAGFTVNPTNTDSILVGERLYGDMVETQKAVQFYLTGKMPNDISPDSKVIPGQLIVNEVDKRFIPGKLMTTADGERFVPGQTVNTSHGEEFIPGQIVESSDGPKFVPGQVVMTSKGEKFVPGQVIVEDDGPKFVPGQIIQTKNGATFIPGQMMSTDEGQLFVPGQLVETNAGPRFVPGQVVESPEGPKFIPGTIIETDEGLKYVPPDADEIDEDFQISFQGFEISEEELALLMTNPTDTRPHSPIMSEEGLIDSATLKKLAMDTVFVHGVTPEPPPPLPEKKKKKKKARVQLDAVEEDGKEEVEEPDDGTDKVDVLLRFIRASTSMSQTRRAKEMKKLSRLLGEREYDNMTLLQVDAMAHILSTVNGTGEVVRVFLGENEQLISDIVDYVDSTDTDSISRNDQAKRTLRKAVQRVVAKYCDKEIDDIIHLLNINPENLLTDTRIQVLLTEAVGIVCVTGNVEVAAMLERFISEPSDPNALRDNPDVVSVLRQLVVLHKIAERDTDVAKMLQVLQTNPEGLKDRRKIRELLKNANLLLRLPKVEGEDVASFDLRHVASSKDIPTKIFEQIREDRKEADKFIDMLPDELFREILQDKRCGESFLETLDSEKASKAKSELHKFKKGMAIVITKDDMQAVIPKEFARSICYGIVPYLLIDEEGFKFFERDLVIKTTPDLVIKTTPDLVIKTTLDLVIKTTPDLVIKTTPDLVIKTTLDLVIKITLDLVIKTTPDLVIKTTPDLRRGGAVACQTHETTAQASWRSSGLPDARDDNSSVVEELWLPDARDDNSSVVEELWPARRTRRQLKRRGGAVACQTHEMPTQASWRSCGLPDARDDNSSVVEELWPARRTRCQLKRRGGAVACQTHETTTQASWRSCGLPDARDANSSVVEELWPARRTRCQLKRRGGVVACQTHEMTTQASWRSCGLPDARDDNSSVVEELWHGPVITPGDDCVWCRQRAMSGEQYSMVMLGKRRSSAVHDLLYTSLLPSSGPTRLSYTDGGINGDLDDVLPYRRSSRAGSLVWNDLDSASLTSQRKALNGYGDYQRRGSQTLSDFDDMDGSSNMQRRASRGHNDVSGFDAVNFIYRRPTREELDDYGTSYSALMPCNPVVLDEVTDPAPLCRSDTVAKLLDKYTNFSTRREFGYHPPNSAWARHVGKTRDFVSGLPDFKGEDEEQEPELVDEEGYTTSERAMLPPTKLLACADAGKHRNVSDTRDHLPRSLTNNREAPSLPDEYSVVPVEDGTADESRGGDSTYLGPDINLMTHDSSYIPRTSYVSNKPMSKEDQLVSTPPPRRKAARPAAQEVNEVQDPLESLPPGRPGGALQRYMERKARETRAVHDQSEASEERIEPPLETRSRVSKTSRGRQLQEGGKAPPQSQGPRNWPDQDDLRTSLARDSYGPASQESPYRHTPDDRFDRTPQDPYRRPEDQYNRMSQDAYGRTSLEPYVRDMQDSYGRTSGNPSVRGSQDTYGRDQNLEDSYGDRSMKSRYVGEDPSLGSYSQRRPTYGGVADGYSQDLTGYGGSYGTTGYGSGYGGGGGYDTGGGGGGGDGGRYGSAYSGNTYSTGGGSYGSGYSGTYVPGGGYSSSYAPGVSYGGSYASSGGYGGTYAPSGGYGGSYAPSGGYSGSYVPIGGYSGSYASSGGYGSYGSGYDVGGDYTGNYAGTNRSYPTTGYQGPPLSTGLGSLPPVSGGFLPGRQSVGRTLVPPKLLPDIDEEDSHSGRSLTPRQEERSRISILAQKYLNKPMSNDD
ncbi:uncharacterized protein [Cherax quadricarinatus]|uniref:uncharacterized protein n=1 Tax=Cherax quadricarinatus TaxID=27406 RepID=UPI00387ED903